METLFDYVKTLLQKEELSPGATPTLSPGYTPPHSEPPPEEKSKAQSGTLKKSEPEPPPEEDSYPVMKPALFGFISILLPRGKIFGEEELDLIFKKICWKVKNLYPDYCQTKREWIKTSHKLFFYDFTKVWVEYPHFQTADRIKAWEWLFDRFSTTLDKVENESEE